MRNNQLYNHIQRGKLMLIPFLAGVAFVIAGVIIIPPRGNGIILFVVALMALVTLNFVSLTITVTKDALTWKFGIGLFRKSVPLTDISSVEPVRTKWWYGWGIHLTPKGWLYNVEGFEAVLITLRNGKRFMLGTNDTEQLIAAIRQGMPS